MTNTSETQPSGGAAWELGRASERMAHAVLSGDAAEIQRAMSDHAAALGTQATAAMASIAAALLTGQDKILTRLDSKERIDLDYRVRLQTQLDTRFDAFGVEVDRLSALPGEVRAELRTFLGTMDDLAGELAELRQQMTTVGESARVRYGALETQIGALSAQVETQLRDLSHQMLGDTLSRQRRLLNVAFLELLMAERPDLVELARRIVERAD